MFNDFYRNKRVLVTGHTGFKGSWLCEWLLMLHAEPIGYSLPPETDPTLFTQLGLSDRLVHHTGDVCNRKQLAAIISSVQPDVVFHLAAQSLVRRSYQQPVETYQTNVMGTVHLLDALRIANHPCSVIIITSDKCYENHGWSFGYRENDTLGGHDPYSSSKACAELVTHSFRQSFFSNEDNPIAVASARAGNVIGGGDWAQDRIVPDCVRAFVNNSVVPVRNPRATRPWQHVLDPLSGYLLLGQMIYPGNKMPDAVICGAYNFGPGIESNQTVKSLVESICTYWPGEWKDVSNIDGPAEALLLNLNTDKAWHYLRWRPVWDFKKTVRETVGWYRKVLEQQLDAKRTADLTQCQIESYCCDADGHGHMWAKSHPNGTINKKIEIHDAIST